MYGHKSAIAKQKEENGTKRQQHKWDNAKQTLYNDSKCFTVRRHDSMTEEEKQLMKTTSELVNVAVNQHNIIFMA